MEIRVDRVKEERRKELSNRGKEQRGGLLLVVNNTGRHFNYYQPAQINYLCLLDKDTHSFSNKFMSLSQPFFSVLSHYRRIMHFFCT